jgi:hypothetical protein
MTINPRQLGHDGRCDDDCPQPATSAVLYATTPECGCGICPWDTGPPAALGFLCQQHAQTAPIATLSDAQHNAALVDDPDVADVWHALLDAYPTPIPLI